MEKRIVRIYLKKGSAYKKHFWEKPKLRKRLGYFGEIPIMVLEVPEFYKKKKPMQAPFLSKLLKEELSKLEEYDIYYLPYSFFQKEWGDKIPCVPTFTILPEELWKEEACRYPEYEGLLLFEGEGFCYQDFVFQRARTLKYLGIVKGDGGSLNHDEELEEFAEKVYEEYGLYVNIGDSLSTMFLPIKMPLLVLDGSKEKISNVGGINKESIWIDFWSDTKKRRRIENSFSKNQYFSLKKALERVQYIDID